MQIVVTPDGVELRRPDNFREFEALVSGDQLQLPDVLEPDGEQHLWVQEEWLRSALTQANLAAGWQQKYQAMLDYARSKGWVREQPLSVRAHIVRTET
ncbi:MULTISPECIES: hypothetical protein [unclassified Bradyrhizobium]|jgi:hypothetical protein|uniref:hypothetical protein n=1 Tax=unclassified Bradyrhizobium TaxID=2631580 RepID=UPI000467214C|nr:MULTISPECIES: hypothetical protein [unclassified Bradyrhizobium]AUC98372.1 hypothetical protein CWS35_32045 [Bradyrhizobium sp. SK17]MBK5652010.1 hypothetical protein [Rhizobium sp.]OCX32648.1 hypothetical protein QU42_02565 [Bradyrhizobium sp. UASWS1016]